MKRPKKPSYQEGDVFAYPLVDTGKFGIGLVGRVAPRGGIIKIYLFDFCLDTVPQFGALPLMTKQDVVRYMRTGDRFLLQERWKVLGQLVGWRRDQWCDRVYWQKDPIRGFLFLAFYEEDDPSDLLERRRTDVVPANISPDGLAGVAFVEKVMEKHFKIRQQPH